MRRAASVAAVVFTALGAAACDGCGASPAPTPGTAPEASRSSQATADPAVSSAPPKVVPPPPRVLQSLEAKDVRETPIVVPEGGSPDEKLPFVLFLHGLGGTGASLVGALRVEAAAGARRFAWAAPDGEVSTKKQRFWNATAACCDFDKKGTPHVEHLGKLIEKAKAHPRVDPAKVFVVGFSNGGFMAHRLACEVPGIAGIVSLAGGAPSKAEGCSAKAPVAVLQIHGDEDKLVPYAGGHTEATPGGGDMPSAFSSVVGWAARNGCAKHETKDALEVDGKPASRATWTTCKKPVSLVTLQGGSHFAPIASGATKVALDFLLGG